MGHPDVVGDIASFDDPAGPLFNQPQNPNRGRGQHNRPTCSVALESKLTRRRFHCQAVLHTGACTTSASRPDIGSTDGMA